MCTDQSFVVEVKEFFLQTYEFLFNEIEFDLFHFHNDFCEYELLNIISYHVYTGNIQNQILSSRQ